jgi:type 1 glutamine amidotransferase
MSSFDPRVILRPMLLALPVFFASTLTGKEKPPPSPPPIRALLVTGGCSHDYPIRQEILTRGLRERVARPIEWVVRQQGLGESDARIPLFESAEWAEGYDIVVHDHCFPRVRDTAYVDRVLAPHRAGTPAVLLHGTMMSFRTGDDRWFDFTGLTTHSHERERAIRIEALAPADPVLKGFAPWEIPREELYRVETAQSGIVALTRCLDPAGEAHVTSWTHRYGPAQARVFGTTLGNATATLADERYLDLVARGFLWGLGPEAESAFQVVSANQLLKDLAVPPPSKSFSRPGPNPLQQGDADGFQWGETAVTGVEFAHDGDPATVWRPGVKGPGWWSVRFARPQTLSLVAVWWEGSAPDEAGIEGSTDGRSWVSLGRLKPTSRPDEPIVVSFEPRNLTGVRLNVSRTAAGKGFAIREVAAYGSEEALPAALLMAAADPPGMVRYRTVGDGDLATIRLAPGWILSSLESISPRGNPSQLLPTAGGEVFVTTFPREGEPGQVHRIRNGGEGGGDHTAFLSGIAAETRIAWDGEWLYALSGPRLERVRRALGEGPADERQRFDHLFEEPAEGAPVGLAWTDLQLSGDGWLTARYLADRAGFVVRREGGRVPLATRGAVRFRRDGSGFSVGEAPPVRDPLEGIAAIEGLALVVRLDSWIWFLRSGGETSLQLGCLIEGTAPSPSLFVPDEIPTEALPAAITRAAEAGRRRDLAWELARRKHPPLGEMMRSLSARPQIGDASPLVAVLAAQPGSVGKSALLPLTTDRYDPVVRAAAFRALGDVPGDLDATVFRDLGVVTEPVVTAAIFDGMRRRGASLPGAESMALRLSHHPDAEMAAAAFAFLRELGGRDAAFSALDSEARRQDWPSAFELLATRLDPGVIDGIQARLSLTRDPELRRGLLGTLARMRTTASGETWSGTAEIDAVLIRLLSDPRVDRVALLEAMEQARVPLDDPALLVRLAGEYPGLEAHVIGRLLELGGSLPEDGGKWLEAVAGDPAHDGDLRRSARALLSGGSRESGSPSSPPLVKGPAPPDTITDGGRLFRSSGCSACHNLDGEGFSAGPDLVSVLSGLEDSKALHWLAHPPAPSLVRLETFDGRILRGWVLEESAEHLSVIDFAGNRFRLARDSVAFRSPAEADESPCDDASQMGSSATALLLQFLRGHLQP